MAVLLEHGGFVQYLVGAEVNGVPLVRVLGDEAQGAALAGAADQHVRPARGRLGQAVDVAQLVVLPVEGV